MTSFCTCDLCLKIKKDAEKRGKEEYEKQFLNNTPCGCGDEYLWYDSKLRIHRCRNCGWCN